LLFCWIFKYVSEKGDFIWLFGYEKREGVMFCPSLTEASNLDSGGESWDQVR
jgi:hypothetical protein